MGSLAEHIRQNDQARLHGQAGHQQQGVTKQGISSSPATPEEAVMQLQASVGNQALAEMIDAGLFSKEKQPRASGPGKKMPKDVQQKMEASFQTDFSDVDIHEDPKVASMGARAYAQSNQLYFAPGQFSPHTQTGQSLLGHELAHVVQQREGRVDTPQGKGMPIVLNPELEAEADQAGERAARGLPAGSANTHSTGEYGAQLNSSQHAPIQASFFSKALGGIKKAGQAFVDNGGLQIVGGALLGAAGGFAASRGEEGEVGSFGMAMKGVGLLGGLLMGLGGKKDKGADEAENETEEVLEEIEDEISDEDKKELINKMGVPTPEEDDDMYEGLAELFKEEDEDDEDLGLRWLFGEEETVSEQPSTSKTASSASSASSSQKASGATKTTSAKTKKTKSKK